MTGKPADEPLKRFLEGLVFPAALFAVAASMAFLCSMVLQYLPDASLIRSCFKLFPLIPYFILIGGIITGWRFSNTGIILTALFLCLIYLAFNTYAPPVFSKSVPVPAVCKAAILLFPLNIILVSLLTKRQIFITTGSLYLFLFLLEISAVALFCNPTGDLFKAFKEVVESYSFRASNELFYFAKDITLFINRISLLVCIVMSLWTFIFLIARYYYKRDISIAGFAGIFVTIMTGMLLSKHEAVLMIYFIAAGIMLILSAAESSFSLNPVDKLTNLPSRKTMKKDLAKLKGIYSIAMVDIDDFNRFNDEFGSDAGDNVIGIVADKLADMIRGVKVFRFGGEEFIALFPGFEAGETIACLETYRKKIESFPLLVKNKKIPKKERFASVARQAQVTVSIGVATAGKELPKPGDVLAAADRALAFAKKGGKNRVTLFKKAKTRKKILKTRSGKL